MAAVSECSMSEIYCMKCITILWVNTELYLCLEVRYMIWVCATVICIVISSLMFTSIIEYARG